MTPLPPTPVCRFKTLPCVRSKRPLVYREQVHMCKTGESGLTNSALCQFQRNGCCDGLHIFDSACVEDVFRQVQMVECALLKKHQNDRVKAQFCFGISEEMPLFVGTHRESGHHMVYSDLLDFVNREVGKSANTMNQLRKAREEQHLAPEEQEGSAVSLRSPCLACSLYVCAFLSRDCFQHSLLWQ